MARKKKITDKDITGLKYFEQLAPLLERLRPAGTERDKAGNRNLFLDQYCMMVLLFLFNAIVDSLRGMQQASELKKVQKKLSCSRASLGSLSEATDVFDRGQTPEMVRKEIWTCLLAYNLIRKTMLQAALDTDLSPRPLRFTSAMQTMTAGWVVLPTQDSPTIDLLIKTTIGRFTSQLVGKRPNRFEPRAVKRRPKPIRLFNMTRDEARELLRSGIDPYTKQK